MQLHDYSGVAILASFACLVVPYVLTGALIPSLRRADRLGDRFSDEQIDAILDSVQSFLLGLSQPYANGDDEGGLDDHQGDDDGADEDGDEEMPA